MRGGQFRNKNAETSAKPSTENIDDHYPELAKGSAMVDGIRSQVVAKINGETAGAKNRRWNRNGAQNDMIENAHSRMPEDSGSSAAEVPSRWSERSPAPRPEVFNLSEAESDEGWSSPAANLGTTPNRPTSRRRPTRRRGKTHACAPVSTDSASCAFAAYRQRPGGGRWERNRTLMCVRVVESSAETNCQDATPAKPAGQESRKCL